MWHGDGEGEVCVAVTVAKARRVTPSTLSTAYSLLNSRASTFHVLSSDAKICSFAPL